MKRQGRRHYGGKARPAGIPARVGIRESRAQFASFPRHDVFAGYDPEKEEQVRRRALLSQALDGNGIALAELRALRLTHWERGGKVLIQDGDLVGVKRTERGDDQASAG
jgi:hypothetical protein